MNDFSSSSVGIFTKAQADAYYALLAGRSGGQTLYGGTGASENLVLNSTSHVTKGQVLLASSTLVVDGNTGLVGINQATPTAILDIAGNKSFASWGTSGVNLKVESNTLTDTTGSGTIAFQASNSLGVPTLVATNPITLTMSTNLYIAGAPVASTNVTHTERVALFIDTGNASSKGIIVRAAASQSADIQSWRKSDDTVFLAVANNGQLKIGYSALNIPAFIFRDTNAGDSTNPVSLAIGNLGTSQGYFLVQYTNAAASGAPQAQFSFQPRNNAGSTIINPANITIAKTAGADTASIALAVTAGSLTLDSAGSTTAKLTDSATASVVNIATLGHNSSGTPAASFGTGLLITGQSNTTVDRSMGRVRTFWSTSTDASRASKMVLSTFAIGAEVDVLTLDSTGSASVGLSTQGTPLTIFRDASAGDSTNAVSIGIGNSGNAQGKFFLQYVNAAASGAPQAILSFQPRNNAGSTAINPANITVSKTAGADTASIAFSVAAGSLTLTAAGLTSSKLTDSATNTVTNVATIGHNSSGSVAASFGTGLAIQAQDSSTADITIARFRSLFTTATHNSMATRSVLSAFDNAANERDVIGWGANLSAALLGFYPTVAAAPIVQPASANQAAVVTTPATLASYGFTQAQADSIVTLVNQLRSDLVSLGLIKGAA